MGLEKPIGDYESVQGWAEGLRKQWGGDPLAEEPERMESLRQFCEFIGKDPDELLAFCFLRKKATGQRFGSVKRREAVASQLREFRDASGMPEKEARRAVNDVLSFLIHSGVLIHKGMV